MWASSDRIRRAVTSGLVLWVSLTASACSEADIAAAGDGGEADASSRDAGSGDSGTPDGGADGGTVDAGDPDSGAPDAGGPDGGTPDAGDPDAGPWDGGGIEAPGPGDVVISEMMVDTDAVTDDDAEWFELYNPSPSVSYDLTGCQISDEATCTRWGRSSSRPSTSSP